MKGKLKKQIKRFTLDNYRQAMSGGTISPAIMADNAAKKFNTYDKDGQAPDIIFKLALEVSDGFYKEN